MNVDLIKSEATWTPKATTTPLAITHQSLSITITCHCYLCRPSVIKQSPLLTKRKSSHWITLSPFTLSPFIVHFRSPFITSVQIAGAKPPVSNRRPVSRPSLPCRGEMEQWQEHVVAWTVNQAPQRLMVMAAAACPWWMMAAYWHLLAIDVA